jgi:alkenylglycerophosphocholine/alkenylglycerophosphoethanolamine hydrolase
VAQWGTGVVIAAVGAVCFMISDSMIGISRFIRPFPGHDLAIIVTYHLALIALVLSLRP